MDGLRLFSIEEALIGVTANFFIQHATDARTVLATIPDASALLAKLLDGGHTRAAGRLAGAFRNIGADKIADDIMSAMKTALHDVRENDPFEQKFLVIGSGREQSPYVHCIRLMWREMREDAIEGFPAAQPPPNDIDAYHSLSIEGYRVSPELIERVRSGAWNPDSDAQGRAHRDALAVRGY